MLKLIMVSVLCIGMSAGALAAEGGMDGQPRGTAHEGYGRDNPRGKSGGYEYGKNPVYNGTRRCGRCEDIDYDHPSSVAVTKNSSSASVNLGATGPAPTGGVTYNSTSSSTTTTYGRKSTGVDADGRSCPCR